ncbi:hypothetical protein MAC_02439 [Metarhizium acridum CQMa 102]|uniref:Uncharacterized protein n=1 Tax=Metarhizium acridum (strain CQMa 102) TaxID=655827 RepID=E9DXU1_METAQ|nr:uncharacterized protein MAC_02439 [Metarhizium acridum CQMa 102]EFY91554.1 hypothetical protein MAC_02439 [Metarhizium acridum CQMa 102]
MKFLNIVLAVSGALAIPRDQQSAEIAHSAEDVCGRAENINMDKCKTDTEECIRKSLAEQELAALPPATWIFFWANIKTCGLLKQIQQENMTVKNFVALHGSDASKIECQVEEGSVLHCDEWSPANPGPCLGEPNDCHPFSELPELCAKAGGCKTCESELVSRFGGTPGSIKCELEK